ncbi:hypothetical protein CFT13S00388_02590 [Campylobacter fetus subsp. testudinum]|uniref:hypothetical protein n=1 Tax=Campylobacter fetus TaxID=196 RepID=UPI000818854A|nr:hypothetical protein [Campylobacter fetus]OCR88073.1 hypothetical protein CFT13S00388_02590 [Campylobacter fetus subsp. testudinum]
MRLKYSTSINDGSIEFLNSLDDVKSAINTGSYSIFVNIRGVKKLKDNLAKTYREAYEIADKLSLSHPAQDIFISLVPIETIATEDIDF